jgi:hypothetical protein
MAKGRPDPLPMDRAFLDMVLSPNTFGGYNKLNKIDKE